MDAERLARIHGVIRAEGMKGEFARVAKRILRETPEYAEAKKKGCAREWLEAEAASFAEASYSLLLERELEAP